MLGFNRFGALSHLGALLSASLLIADVEAQRGGGGGWGGGQGRISTQERLRAMAETRAALLDPLELDQEQRARVDAILDTQDTERRELMEDLFSGGERPDRETMRAMREDMQKRAEEIGTQLRDVMGSEKFELFIQAQQQLRQKRGWGGRRSSPSGGGPRGGGGDGSI